MIPPKVACEITIEQLQFRISKMAYILTICP